MSTIPKKLWGRPSRLGSQNGSYVLILTFLVAMGLENRTLLVAQPEARQVDLPTFPHRVRILLTERVSGGQNPAQLAFDKEHPNFSAGGVVRSRGLLLFVVEVVQALRLLRRRDVLQARALVKPGQQPPGRELVVG